MKKCIHCGIELDKMTRDHVFPSSWYTDNTPSRVQRWTVPSCLECNNKFGAVEMDLLIRMVPCIDQNKPEVSGLRKTVYAALGIKVESKLSKEEFEKRKALAFKIYGELHPYKNNIKTFPNFGPHEGVPPERQHVINIPDHMMTPVLEKVFRGAEYILNNKRIIESPFELKVFYLREEFPELKSLLNRFGRVQYLGPGFQLYRVVSESNQVIYKAVIWGTWTSYSSISLRE